MSTSARGLIQAAFRGGAAVGRASLDQLQYLEQPSLDSLVVPGRTAR